MFRRLGNAALVTGLCLGFACDADKPEAPPETGKKSEPAAEKKPPVDSKIAQAMAKAAGSPDTAPAPGLAPPPTGILDAAEAARQAPIGRPAQLTLGSTGAKPRLTLASPLWAAGKSPTGKFVVGGRTAGGVLPNIDVSVEVALSTSEAEPKASGRKFAVQLIAALPSADQPGRLPPGADKAIAGLNGSVVEMSTAANGAVPALQVRPKTESPEVRPLLDKIAESLAAIFLPYPEQEVGVGAYWMVTSRENIGGVDTVTYRMLRVTKVTGNVAEVDIKTRRYLARTELSIEGLPPHIVRQFQSEGSGSFSLAAGAAMPSKIELKQTMLAMVAPNDRPQQALPLQTDSQVSMEWKAAE